MDERLFLIKYKLSENTRYPKLLKARLIPQSTKEIDLNESNSLTDMDNSRKVGDADSTATWSHPDSLEPVTKRRNAFSRSGQSSR
jgi:hypothetical protein